MYTRFMADNGVCERRREFVEGLYIYAKEFYEDASVKIRGARKRENGNRKCFEGITKRWRRSIRVINLSHSVGN